MKYSDKGFTLIELVVVLGLALTLFGFVIIGLSSSNRTFSTSSSRDTIISDLTSQQSKSMQGVGGGGAYGIYFQPDRYVLFGGDSYSPGESSNFEVELNEEIVVSDISFPASTIVFATKSGEINNYIDGNNTITIQDIQAIKTININLNRYGVISEVN